MKVNAVTIGAILLVVGLIAAAVGFYGTYLGPTDGGANIGAGMLLLGGLPLAIAGGIVLIVGLVERRRR